MKLFKKIKCVKKNINTNESEYSFYPFEKGIANTLGNSMRRTLLAMLSSYSIIAIKVKGAKHEFTSLPNTKEDLPTIILSLKKIVFKVNDKLFGNGSEKINVSLDSKKGIVKGSAIKCPTGVEVVNKDLYIATTSADGALKLDFILEKNRGYESFNINNAKSIPANYIGIDAIYSPVENVSFSCEELNTHKNFVEEKLILTIKTNGSISEDDALDKAAKILIDHLKIFISKDKQETIENEKSLIAKSEEKEVSHFYNWPIEHLNLNIRTYNSLKRANVHTIKDLLEKSKSDLEKMKNFGDKAFTDLIKSLKAKKIDYSKFE